MPPICRQPKTVRRDESLSRPRWCRGGLPRRRCWGAVFSLVLVAWSSAQAQTSNSTLAINHLFPAPPREIMQLVTRVKEATAERRFAEAALSLADLVQRLEEGDYFIIDPKSRVAEGFRRDLTRTLSELNSATLEQFEDLRGGEARGMLDEAIATHDAAKLASCARQWFLTSAGQQATLMLARLDLDRDRAATAVRRLQGLPRGATTARLEPERSLLLARALAQTGRAAEAEQVLAQLPVELRSATFRAGERDLKVWEDGRPAREILTVSAAAPVAATARPEWLVFRGDVARSTVVPPLPPFDQITWKRSLLSDPKEVPNWRNELGDLDTPLAPVAVPLAVGDALIVRSLDRLWGVDARRGDIRWSYPLDVVPRSDPEEAANSASWLSVRNAQRLWQDGSYGRFSSDGRRVFFVDQLDPAEDANQLAIARQRAAFGRSTAPVTSTHNVLVALDIAREGAFLWMVGDVSGQSEPELAGAFFLGPSLPVNGVVYAIAEIKEQVRLVALSPATGQLQWSLVLSQLDSQSIGNFPMRRFAGSLPAYANGILVCPTFAGGVVAVDTATRSFRWGFQYRDSNRRTRGTAPGPFGLPSVAAMQGLRWRNSDVMVLGSQVLIANESDDLFCIDVESAAPRWNRRRGDTMYAEALRDDAVLLVGEYRFTAIRAKDGSYLWPHREFVAIPGGGSPAGRGVCDGDFYYLPTTDPELLQIKVADGSVTARHRVAERLGNLIAVGDRLISQDESQVVALVGQAPPALAQEPAAVADESPLSDDLAAQRPEQLRRMLASDRFTLRDAATRELLRRGSSAIAALSEGTRSSDPEVAFRSAAALIGLLDSSDPQVVVAARQPLLAASLPSAPHRHAGSAYAWEARRRSPAVIRELQRLGAIVQSDGRAVSLSPAWRGGTEGLVHLLWLPQAESLELRHASINDQGLGYIRGLPQLKTLNLHRSTVTSAGLQQISELSSLESLFLQGTQVNDDAVEPLGKMKQLKAINLLDTKFSAEGVERLQQLLPMAKILH